MGSSRALVGDERLGCGEKALFLSGGEPCARSLQCVMAPQAFERLKAAVEDLCDALQQPAEIALQRQLLCLVEQRSS